jgi:CRP-like cAMP-binding protein
LKAQPNLEGLPSEVLAVLASYSNEASYPAGAWIRRAGESIGEVFFIGKGVVEVGGPGDSEWGRRQVSGPGGVGLAHHFARLGEPPSIRAIDETVGLEIDVSDFDQIIEDHFPLLFEMSRTTALHVVEATRELGSDRIPEPGFPLDHMVETPIELDLVQRLSRARRAPFLHGTNLTALATLIREHDSLKLEKDEMLWSAGDPVDGLALVLDGSLRTVGDFGESSASPGATLGAWEILSDKPRFEGWVAAEASRLLVVQRDQFVDLLEDHFEFGLAYLQRASERLVSSWWATARRNEGSGSRT